MKGDISIDAGHFKELTKLTNGNEIAVDCAWAERGGFERIPEGNDVLAGRSGYAIFRQPEEKQANMGRIGADGDWRHIQIASPTVYQIAEV